MRVAPRATRQPENLSGDRRIDFRARNFPPLFGRIRSQRHTPGKAIITLTAQNNKCIVIAVHGPRTWGDFAEFCEFPIARILVTQPQIIANGRRNVQARALVQIWPRALVSEHVLPVIRTEGTTILPLCITNSVSVSNGDPSTLKNALTIANISISEPWNHLTRLAFGVATFHVVIRESDIKRILARHEI